MKVLQGETAPVPGAALSAMFATRWRLDPMALALLRLDDARLRQNEAMQNPVARERRREELEAMVSFLEQRVTVPESGRDQGREDTRADVQRELLTRPHPVRHRRGSRAVRPAGAAPAAQTFHRRSLSAGVLALPWLLVGEAREDGSSISSGLCNCVGQAVGRSASVEAKICCRPSTWPLPRSGRRGVHCPRDRYRAVGSCPV